jgi:2-polyprenyl-6-methoxyphenol hydroxylase-like FAD-dependent oxidoreductase
MSGSGHPNDMIATDQDPASARPDTGGSYDAVIVGASLAGCATAILLGRGGARVALVEQRPDPAAYKKICSHYIQASAVGTLERIGLLEPMLEQGAQRSRVHIRTPWGWIDPPEEPTVPAGVNLRRERLDPLIRTMAEQTDGVDLLMGLTVQSLLRDGDTVCGVVARDVSGAELELRGRLVVGADGRGSRIAKLAGVRERRVRHGRIAYGAYFEGGTPAAAPDASFWLMDPNMVAAFPTDEGLTFYAAMPVKEHAEAFREDPETALVEMLASVPDAPPIREARRVTPMQGKLDLTNVAHTPTAPGLALVGDAALAIDPLWGVGCGWALQSAEWLADSVAQPLVAGESLTRALRRYRRAHARALRGHALMMYDYAGGRKMNPGERFLFSAATFDDGVARIFEEFGTRCIGPARMFASAPPRAIAAHVRRAFSGRRARPVAATAASNGSAASAGR